MSTTPQLLRPNSELKRRIQTLIDEILDGDDKQRAEWVQEVGALPLWGSIGGEYFIRPDGTVLADEDYGPDHPCEGPVVANAGTRIMAIVIAAEKRPEFAALLPARDSADPDCGQCDGTGRHPIPFVVCQRCFGLGWLRGKKE